MTDRELLELAAKAAGIEFYFCRPDLGGCQIRKGLTFGWWNPLTDDGDALRLAVKLHIGLGVESYVVNAYTRLWDTADVVEYTNADFSVQEATRRAIVRAAAEIGKGMK